MEGELDGKSRIFVIEKMGKKNLLTFSSFIRFACAL